MHRRQYQLFQVKLDESQVHCYEESVGLVGLCQLIAHPYPTQHHLQQFIYILQVSVQIFIAALGDITLHTKELSHSELMAWTI